MAKLKLTPFARLFFFLLVFIPLGYFGYQYLDAEMNGTQTKSSSKAAKSKPSAKTKSDCDELLLLKDREIEVLKNRIKELS